MDAGAPQAVDTTSAKVGAAVEESEPEIPTGVARLSTALAVENTGVPLQKAGGHGEHPEPQQARGALPMPRATVPMNPKNAASQTRFMARG